MYEKMIKNLTTGVRLMTGVVLLLAGLVWQVLSGKTLDRYAFYIMAAAILFFLQVIVERMAGEPVDPVQFILFNLVVLIAGFAVTGAGWFEGMTLYGFWGLCFVGDWILNISLIPCEGMAKRGVLGFVTVVLNVVLVGAVFMIPVLMAAKWIR